MVFRYLVRFTNVELLNWSKVHQQEMKFSECFDRDNWSWSFNIKGKGGGGGEERKRYVKGKDM